MLTKLNGRPLWYKAWAVSVAVAAVFMLFRLFSSDGLGRVDYAVMVFVHVSILLDFVLFPTQKDKKTEGDVV
jgi:uncharacterized membrane protein